MDSQWQRDHPQVGQGIAIVRVLLLTEYAPAWDTAPASRLLHLAREIARAGHEARVVGSATKGTPPRVEGVSVHALPHDATGPARAIFPFRRAVRQQLHWCDALLVRGYWVGFWPLLYSAVVRRQVRIYDFHGFVWKEQLQDGRPFRSLSTRILERLALVFSTTITVVSQGTMDELDARSRNKALLLPNAISIAEFEKCPDVAATRSVCEKIGLQRGRTVFVAVAHFGPWLDAAEPVRAVAELAGEATLLLIGDGPGIDQARAERGRLEIENVCFAGRLSHTEVTTILCSVADACLCPYSGQWVHAHTPGFFASRKIMEYLAAGKPVIVSDVGGRPAFLAHGKNCLVYRAGDAHSLALAMKQVVQHGQAVSDLARNARHLAKNFTWSHSFVDSGLADTIAVSGHARGATVCDRDTR